MLASPMDCGKHCQRAADWVSSIDLYILKLVVYTIYDMTDHSLVRYWLLRVSLIDICPGELAIESLAAAWMARWLGWRILLSSGG